jgi:murein hydrolase activator
MRLPPRSLLRVLLPALLLALAPAGAGAAQDRRRAEADLQTIRAQIDKVRQQVRQDAVQRDRLSRDLRSAEESVAQARGELSRLRRERAERDAARAELAAQRTAREAQLEAARAALSAQVRAAYLLGRDEPLKLLLNQRDPGEAGRNFAYYGYVGRMRAGQMAEIREYMASLDEVKAAIDAEDAELARLEAEQRRQVDGLEQARRERRRVLASLVEESRSRSQQLTRLQQQQGQLEKLLRDLDRALERFPVDPNDAFAKLRGRLAWPVAGELAAKFGDTRAGGVRWNGVLVATERGTPVRAIHPGRVAYADWLPGLGLLMIVDHGGGYLSLYGHNEQLYRAAGDSVKAGDTLAAAGDTGGRSRAELYFEIRRAGKPVDPRPWFRTPAPPRR